MKTIMKIFAVLLVLNMSSLMAPQKASAQASVNFQVFYDQLSPYGSWVNYPNYGYAWIPNAGPGFSPYGTAGHWVFSDFGWTWASDYPWGWAPFHYGRWYFDPIYGWIWVPDTVWGPAWVVWRNSPGYFGWAPLRPGVSINIAVGSGFYVPNDWWVFVPGQYIASPTVYNYYVPRSNNVTIIKNTKIINKTYVDNNRHATYMSGPERDYVQQVTGKPVKSVAIVDNDKPGQNFSNGQLKMYRPQVQRAEANNSQRPAPRKVENLKDIKPVKERNAEDQMNRAAPTRQQPATHPDAKPADKNLKQPQLPQRNVQPPKEQPQPHNNPQERKDKEEIPKQSLTGAVNQNVQSDIDRSQVNVSDHEQKALENEAPKKRTEIKRDEEVNRESRQAPPKSEKNKKTMNR